MKKALVYLSAVLCLAIALAGCSKGGEVKLGEYKGIEVAPASIEVTEEDLQQRIIQILEENSYREVTGRPVKAGDVVNIDYQGLKDGVAFQGGTAAGYDLTIGSGAFIPGFEDQLIGAETGESRDLNITFPENYGGDLGGQPVVFKVTVNAIKEPYSPEWNDEFIQEFADGFDTVEAYEAELKNIMTQEKQEQARVAKVNSVWNTIMNEAEVVSYPNDRVKKYVKQNNEYYENIAAANNMKFEDMLKSFYNMSKDDYNKQIEQVSRNQVAEELVVEAIAEKENITVSEEEYEQGIEKYMKNYGYTSKEDFMEEYGEELIRSSLLKDKVLEQVAETAVEKAQ